MTFKQIIIGEIVVFFILNLFFRYTKIGKRIVLLPSELKGRRKHRITLRTQLATRKEELKTYKHSFYMLLHLHYWQFL